MSKAAGKGASKKGAASNRASKSKGNKGASKSANKNSATGKFTEDYDEESSGRSRYSSKATSKGAGRYASKSASKAAARKATPKSTGGGWIIQGVQNNKQVAYKVPSNQMELYIKYTQLSPNDLASILQYIERFTEIAVDEYQYIAGRKIQGEARLKLVYAQTGNSVTFRFDGGWLPRVTITPDGKIEIAVGTKMGLAAFVFYALVTGVNSSLDTGAKYYDYQLKKLEYEEKAEVRAEREKKAKEKEEAGKHFIDSLKNNEFLTQVRVNNVNLKNATAKK